MLERVLQCVACFGLVSKVKRTTLYITAMQRLCEEQHFDGHRVAHLRQVARVMEAMRGPVDPDELKAGEEHALQFEQWDGRSVQPC